MTVVINSKSYEAKAGERLIDVARVNHAHIGYFCGGNSICQTCYVTVLKGAELLSPISDTELAMLSDRLISEGTRMACLTTVEKTGTIEIRSVVEEVKEMFESNPLQLAGYAGKMGWESLVKIPDTMKAQSTRTFDLWQLISDIIGGIGNAFKLAADALQSTCPEKAECKIIGHIDRVTTAKKLSDKYNAVGTGANGNSAVAPVAIQQGAQG
jgi:chlorosome envelope protein X